MVLLLCLGLMPSIVDAQARRNGRNGRGGQAQRGGRGQDEPETAPVDWPDNPLVTGLLEGYGWQAELSKVGVGPAPASLHAKFNEWINRHHGQIRGSVIVAYVAPAGGRRGARNAATLDFESRGVLSDGAAYHLMVEVEADGVTNPDAPAKGAYEPGKLYVISGSTDDHPIGQDYPRGQAPGEKPGVGLTLSYETASIKVYEAPKPPAAGSAPKPAAVNPAPTAKANVVPIADRPDFLILVHPSHRDWIPSLQESAQPKQPFVLITTETSKGVVAPPKVRFDSGTSATSFKNWMYALVLNQLLDDEPNPLGPVSKLSYTLYYRASEKDKPATLVQGTISGIVTRGAPYGFLRGMIGDRIGHDIKVALGERVYGRDAGTPLTTGVELRHQIAHHVQTA
jgi:hypothetical protein